MLDKEHFELVLQRVKDQVFSGKGEERHGHGQPLEDQPWRIIVDNVGTGFTEGQALKKILELRSFTSFEAYQREALGAIVYIIMSIMHREASTQPHS